MQTTLALWPFCNFAVGACGAVKHKRVRLRNLSVGCTSAVSNLNTNKVSIKFANSHASTLSLVCMLACRKSMKVFTKVPTLQVQTCQSNQNRSPGVLSYLMEQQSKLIWSQYNLMYIFTFLVEARGAMTWNHKFIHTGQVRGTGGANTR